MLGLYLDRNALTYLVFYEDAAKNRAWAISSKRGELDVVVLSTGNVKNLRHQPKYKLVASAKQYLTWMIPITNHARDVLNAIIEHGENFNYDLFKKGNYQMAIKKAVKAAPTKAAPKANKAQNFEKAVVKRSPKVEAEAQEATVRKPRESAAAMFKDLIMDGTMTDDQIFTTVQKKFQLDDKKRSYVAWYRRWLRTHDQNPPEAVAQ